MNSSQHSTALAKRNLRIILAQNNDFFLYYIKANTPQGSCLYPQTAGNYEVKPDSESDPSVRCGLTTNEPNIWVCDIPASQNELLAMIDQLNEQYDSIAELSSKGNFEKFTLLQENRRCMRRITSEVLKVYMLNENYSSALVFVSGQKEFETKAIGYGINVMLGDYVSARQYLDSMPAETEEEVDFIVTQEINLDYLEARRDYQLSPADSLELIDIGSKDFPMSGYARALFYVLTGNDIDLDTITPRSSNKNSSNDLIEKATIKVFPNPLHADLLSIEIVGELSTIWIRYVLLDSNLRIIRSITSKEKKALLDVSDVTNGLYYVKTIFDNQDEAVGKVIILK